VGYWLVLVVPRPSSPAELIVLVLRVIPFEPPPIPAVFSSSCIWRCFCRRLQRKKRIPPTIATKPRTPPTAPPAIAPILEPLLPSSVLTGAGDVEGPLLGVRIIVLVTTLPPSETMVNDVCGNPALVTKVDDPLLLDWDVGWEPPAVPDGWPLRLM